jgi:hypothetical protein
VLMNWAIEYIETGNYVKVTCEGVFSIEEHPACFQKLFAARFWRPGINLLFDNRKFDFGRINADTMRAASQQFHQVSPQLGDGKLALLMKSAHDFGIGRQFEMISDGKSPRAICIFREEREALGWLLGSEAACTVPAF